MNVNFTIGFWAIPAGLTLFYWLLVLGINLNKKNRHVGMFGALDIGPEIAAFFFTMLTWMVYFAVT